MLFRAAHEALGLLDAGDEEASLTDGRLRARVAAYERERAWAPRWVEDELAATHDATSSSPPTPPSGAPAPTPPTPPPTTPRSCAPTPPRPAQEAAELAEQIADLEHVDDAWAAWFAHTAVTRDLADRARHELRARGVDLDDPDDRTTADEWLDAHRAEQADEERYAEITEDDVLDDDLTDGRARDDDRARSDGWPADTGVPDIRETAIADPTEHADPAVRRRVLTLDETTQAVAKAQAALAEIAARRDADAAREAEEEAARRDQLNRWADEAAPTVADDRGDEATTDTAYADAPTLER